MPGFVPYGTGFGDTEHEAVGGGDTVYGIIYQLLDEGTQAEL